MLSQLLNELAFYVQKKENPGWSSLFKFVRNGITDY